MPAMRILKVLGMTPAQWGALPPDVGEGKTNDRLKLREQAAMLIKAEDDAEAQANVRDRGDHGGLIPRIENIEASIRGVAGDVNRRFDMVERRVGVLETSYSGVEMRVTESEKHIKTLESKAAEKK